MKAKLLKKMRERFKMEFDQNLVFEPYKITFRYLRFGNETVSISFKTKEEMFNEYRLLIVRFSGHIYGCYKNRKKKPIELITHCK